jgi:acyl carrier protein
MILEKIAEIIVKTAHCRPEDVKLDTELTDLGIDSLKAITVLFELEDEFDIEIPNEVIPSIVTVRDIVRRLEEHTNVCTPEEHTNALKLEEHSA